MEKKIEVFKRIECLEKFYGIKVSNSAVISEELKSTGGVSDEVKGQWAIDQFIKAAKTLNVDSFVEPLESGGKQLPVIQSITEYEKVYLEQKKSLIESMEVALPFKVRAEGVSRKAVEEAEQVVGVLEDELEQIKGLDCEQDVIRRTEEDLDKAKKLLDTRYQKWSTNQSGVQKDKQVIEEWRLEARNSAIKQHDRDADAKQSLVNALAELKKFLSGLMTKVPCIDPVVRRMGDDSQDPYEVSDIAIDYKGPFSIESYH